MNKLFGINLDFAGMSASFLCAVHCIATPVALSLGLVNTSHLSHNHIFDAVIISIGLIVAGFSLVIDVRKHRSFLPIMLATIGFAFLGFSIMSESGNHLLYSLLGGSIVAGAHFYNWRLSKTLAN